MEGTEKTIAIVYLHRAEDQDNKCMLTSERLIVVYRGRPYSFERQHIRDLYFSWRRLLFPLVAGGISAPLSLLAIFMNLYNPWPLMFIFFLGLALFYLGLQQHPVLTIKDTVKEHDFFLREKTPNLKEFLSFARQVIFSGGNIMSLAVPLEHWQAVEHQAVFSPLDMNEKVRLRLMNTQQLRRWKQQKYRSAGWVVLHLDTVKLQQADIRYEQSGGGDELYAYLYSSFRKEDIVRKEYF